jgi:DNA segregation ATPase FtsK/SpoIIIE, S-DNA-T family
MSSPPVFQRSPRIPVTMPRGEVEIPAPPPAPPAPSVSLLSILLSILPGLLVPAIMYLFSGANGGHSLGYIATSLPMMAVGALVQAGRFYAQQQKYRRDVHMREDKYRALLQKQAQELEHAREMQVAALRGMDPPPAACLVRVRQLDSRLWERSPEDPDFLAGRLGVGEKPFSLSVKVTGQARGLETDPLQAEAETMAAQFTSVSGVPIQLPLRSVGVTGLAGPRASLLAAVRSHALQLAAHHAPDEVKIVALFPAEEAGEWAWLRWLPHAWSDDRKLRFLATDTAGAHQLLAHLYDFIQRRRTQLAARKEGAPALPLPCVVVYLADLRLLENEPILPLLLREGALLGAFTVLLAARKEDLPKECRCIGEIKPGSGRLLFTAAGLSPTGFVPDETAPETAEEFSRALAPLRVHQLDSAAEIPAAVPLLDLLEVSQVEDLGVVGRWEACQPFRSLAVPVGRGPGGTKLLLDLNEQAHGPHGLVAGATGSGKSELLQALVASLAVSFHPHELAFIIVDFKGGGMADAFRELPHLIGTLTNLHGNLARRAQIALEAELKRRQRLFSEAGVTKIDDYIRLRRQNPGLEPLPHLLVIVDEFAELTMQYPDFTRELLTSTVRVGRSLGVHLILAMQNPAGVVNDQILANTKFRLCLRMERTEDSKAVIKCEDAAFITHRGRAYFQVGNNERFELFQSAWGGAPYLPGQSLATEPAEIREVGLDGTRYLLTPAARPRAAASDTTQMQALIRHVRDVAAAADIHRLSGPWLPPLPEAMDLAQVRNACEGWNGQAWLPSGSWLEPVAGLLDDAEHQRQTPLSINLGKEGHLAVCGSPGSGKTTLIQTLITSLVLTHSPEALHLYLVDCTGRALSLFAPLPHVGSVVLSEDTERLLRLLKYLVSEMESRKRRFADLGVNTYTAYRGAGGTPIPGIVLVVDNYPALPGACPEGEELVIQIAREGGGLGIHLVVTAAAAPSRIAKVSNNIAINVTLFQNDKNDYSMIVGRTDGLGPALVPGRGLIKGAAPLEFQTALPVAGATEWDRSSALRVLFQQMDQAWSGRRAPAIRVLPDTVSLEEIARGDWGPVPEEPAVPVGLAAESLLPFGLDLRDGPHFLISGPPESGKTTLLQTWLLSLSGRLTEGQLHLWLVDMGAGGLAPLQQLPGVRGYVTNADDFAAMLEWLTGELQERRGSGTPRVGQFPEIVIAIDDYDAFRLGVQSKMKDLEPLVRSDRRLGLHLVAAGLSSAFAQGYDPLDKALKEFQTGFVLGSSDQADLQPLGLTRVPGEPARALAPGLGFYIRRGRAQKIKAATTTCSLIPREMSYDEDSGRTERVAGRR